MNDYFPQRHPDCNVNDGCSCLVCRCSPLPSIRTNPLRVRLQRTQDYLSRIQHPPARSPITRTTFLSTRINRNRIPTRVMKLQASVACVYKLVAGPTGCPIASSTTVPTGGIGAIAIVDAGYYPTAQSDLDAFDSYFGIPATTITQVWPTPDTAPRLPGLGGRGSIRYRVGSRHGAAGQAIPGRIGPVSNPAMRYRSHLASGAARRKSSGSERRRRGEHELWRCGDCSGN